MADEDATDISFDPIPAFDPIPESVFMPPGQLELEQADLESAQAVEDLSAIEEEAPLEFDLEELTDRASSVGETITDSPEFEQLTSDDAFDLLKEQFTEDEYQTEAVQNKLADEAFRIRSAKDERLTPEDILEMSADQDIAVNVDVKNSTADQIRASIEEYGAKLEAAARSQLGDEAIKGKREIEMAVEEIKDGFRRELVPLAEGAEPSGPFVETGKRLLRGVVTELGEKLRSDTLRDVAEETGNPKLDNEFGFQLAEGVGQFGADLATIGVFTAAGAGAGSIIPGPGTAAGAALGTTIGTGVVLADKTIRSVKEAYDARFKQTGDEDAALQASAEKLPFAVVESVFDRLVLAGLVKPFKTLTPAMKTEAIKQAAGRFPAVKQLLTGVATSAAEEGAGALAGELGQQLATRTFDPKQLARQVALEAAVGGIVRIGANTAGRLVSGETADTIAEEAQRQAEGIATEATQAPEAGIGGETIIPPPPAETTPEGEAIVPIESELTRGAVEPTPIQEAAEGKITKGTDETVTGKTFEFEKREIPLNELVQQKDVPNFKAGADAETGVVGDLEDLPSKFSETSGGNVVVLEKEDGELEVISGRNRLEIARRDSEKDTISAIVIPESENFTIEDAKTLDAELNIRDNQGETTDYVRFFERTDIPIERARERGLLRNTRGKRGYLIGRQGSPELRSLFLNGKISEKAASEIATAAPGNPQLQQIGLDQLINKKASPEQARNMIEVAKRVTSGQNASVQQDLFGGNDQALQDAERLANVATELQGQAQDTLRQLKRAKQVGEAGDLSNLPGISGQINLDDPVAIDREISRLSQEVKDWDSWATKPDLVQQVQTQAVEAATNEGVQIGLDLTQETQVAPVAVEVESVPEVESAPQDIIEADETDTTRASVQTTRGTQTPRGKGVKKSKKTARQKAESRPANVGFPSQVASPVNDSIYGSGKVNPNIQKNPKMAKPPKVSDGISAPAVIDSVAEILRESGTDTPIFEASMKGGTALGHFEVRPEVIRTRTANNIPTAVHEVFHALRKAIYGWDAAKNPWKSGRSKQFRQELFALGKELYGDRKAVAGYLEEGWAEFGKFYITGLQDMQKKAPTVYKWFTGQFFKDNPGIAKAIAKAQADAQLYYSQTPRQRVGNSVVENPTFTSRIRALRKKIKDVPKIIDANWIEQGTAIGDLQQIASQKANRALDQSEKPYDLYKTLRAVAPARLRHMVETAMIDFAGNKVGGSLRDALAIVRGKQQDLINYMFAKRAIALHTDENNPRDPGIELQDAMSVVEELEAENPNFELAAAKVYEWQDGVLNYISQASPEFEQIVERIREVDPGYYIPLQREFKQISDLWERSAQQGATGGSPLKRLRGSGRRIKNPFHSMIQNSEGLISASHRRAVWDSILKISESVEGLGHLIVEAPRGQAPVTTRSMSQILEAMSTELAKNGNVDLAAFFDEMMATPGVSDSLDMQTLTLFAPTSRAPAPNSESTYIMVTKDGKPKLYQVDAGLFDILGGMDPYQLGKVASMLLGTPKTFFTLGTTGLRAGFSFVTNPTRDLSTFLINAPTYTQQGFFPQVLAYQASLVENFVNVASGGRFQSDVLKLAEGLGGQLAGRLSEDRRMIQRTTDNLFKSGFQRVISPGNWLEMIQDVFSIPENSARTAIVRLMLRDMNISAGDPISVEDSQKLLLAFKQITTDFTAAGKLGRVVNRAVPFFNAAIQGPRAFVRSAKANPAAFIANMAIRAGLAAALWWENKDEEWWNELSDQDKYMFTWVPFDNPINGNKEMLRIPRAFEADGLSMALMESILDSAWKENPEILQGWFESFMSSSIPNVEPVFVKEFIDQIWGPGGYDSYWERPIVPFGEVMSLPPEKQFNEFSSETSKFLAEKLVKVLPTNAKKFASPRRIDHAIRGIFGPVASDIVESVESFGEIQEAATTPTEKTLNSMPVVGVLFSKSGQSVASPKSINNFFEKYQEAKLDYLGSERTPEDKALMGMMDDARKSISMLSLIKRDMPTLEERGDISKTQIEIAKGAMKAFEEKDVLAAAGFRIQRRELDKQEKLKKAAEQF